MRKHKDLNIQKRNPDLGADTQQLNSSSTHLPMSEEMGERGGDNEDA